MVAKQGRARVTDQRNIIALLQTLAPPGEWRLKPGADTNFLVAFANPPEGLTEFTAEVVGVRRRRHAGPQGA